MSKTLSVGFACLLIATGNVLVTSQAIPGASGSDTVAIAKRCQRQTLTVVDRGSAVACGHYLWTAAHLFDRGDEEVSVETIHGATIKVKLVRWDTAADLAILELPEGVSLDGPSWCERQPDIGERLYVVGAPSGDQGTVSAGIVSGRHRKLGGWKVLDQTDAAADHGSSGGGVYLQATGELVGLLVAGRHNCHTFYIPVHVMRAWAKTAKVPAGPPVK